MKKSFFVGWLVPVRGDEAKYRFFWQRRQQIAWLPAIYLKIWEFLLKFSRFGLTSLKGNFAMNGVCRLFLTFCRLSWWTIFVSLIDFLKFFDIFYFLDEKNSFFFGNFHLRWAKNHDLDAFPKIFEIWALPWRGHIRIFSKSRIVVPFVNREF